MNVLLLATSYPRITGGLGAYVELLSNGLAERGHKVHVVVRAEPSNSTVAVDGALPVTWGASPSELLRLIRNSDVTHMNGFWLLPVALSLIARTPLVWTHHEYDTTCPIGVGWYRGASTSFAL